MNKGSCRRLKGPLTGALLCLGLSLALGTAAPGPRPSGGPAWWNIRLIVSVEGEYGLGARAAGTGGTPVVGKYSFRARWEGRLEPDEDDFLLVHLKTEVLEWRLSERAMSPGRMTLFETTDALAPDLRLNYVLRDGKLVEFDFGLDGAVAVPVHGPPVRARLTLPRTAAPPDAFPGDRYDDGLAKGSNRVVIPAEDLSRRRAERTFSWEWETGGGPSDARYGFSDRHTVKAVVALAMR